MSILPARLILTSLAAQTALVVLVALAATAMSSGVERTVTVYFISLVAVVGIGLYSGNSGILSFGHLAFMAIAAYLSGILTMPVQMKQLTLPNLPGFLAEVQLALPAAAVVAVLFTMLVALGVGLVLARLDGSSATIATLGLLIIVHGVIIGARDYTRGAQSFFGVPRDTDIWAAAVGCAIALAVARVYRDSVPGLRLRASREDLVAARATGVHVGSERLLAWVISAGVVALAGVLLGHFLGAFSAKKFFFVDTFFLLSMLIVGGMGSVTGAVLGATVITAVTEVLRRLEGGGTVFGIDMPAVFGTTQIGIGLVILFVMFRRSDGLAGHDEWDERVLRRVARAPVVNLIKNKSSKTTSSPALARRPDVATLAGVGLTRHFDGITAVRDVSISVAPGEIVGLIGPNGSGKTTLLNLLSGVIAPSEGTVKVGERDMRATPLHAFSRAGVARTFQNIRLFRVLRVEQNVLVAALRGWPRVAMSAARERSNAALAWVGIESLAQRRAGELSYGDQRRLEIARALALQPAVLLLDEPAAGMHRAETEALMSMLARVRTELGIGVLLVDHDLPLVMGLCDRVVVLNGGQVIASGAAQEVARNPDVIEAYLGKRHRSDPVV